MPRRLGNPAIMSDEKGYLVILPIIPRKARLMLVLVLLVS